MRFMILVNCNRDTEAGAMPPDERVAEMAHYHQELARAGVLLATGGLRPTSQRFRIHFAAGGRDTVDGPFAGPKDLVAGYTLIQVKSREEALEWARRFPNPHGEGEEAEIEVPLRG